MSPPYDAIILGGGAAGLFCAAQAGRHGRRVVVLEHGDRLGRKILISGGGRCNFTNTRTTAANFLSANPHFAKSALARFTPRDFIALVGKHGIAFHEKTAGQLFCDGPAKAIVRMLEDECRAAGVEIRSGCGIRSVSRDTRFTVETDPETIHAAALVVATGGLTVPKLGSTDLGYRLARQFGLKVEPPYPALVPLTFDAGDRGRWCDLAGVAAEVEARWDGRMFREKMLITHRGLSGPAILQISSYWNRPGGTGEGRELRLDLLPGKDFAAGVERRRAAGERASVKTMLAERLPKRLAERWMEVEGFTQPTPPLRKLEQRLHAWTLRPAGSEGFEKAEVTGGGVSTAELDSKTMQARNVEGLFFVGEVVDVTGHLGGYNLQWAWASAHAAAQAL